MAVARELQVDDDERDDDDASHLLADDRRFRVYFFAVLKL